MNLSGKLRRIVGWRSVDCIVGSMVGSANGFELGACRASLGTGVGCRVGFDDFLDGLAVGFVGYRGGSVVGFLVGLGSAVGTALGTAVGWLVGTHVGSSVGSRVSFIKGSYESDARRKTASDCPIRTQCA